MLSCDRCGKPLPDCYTVLAPLLSFWLLPKDKGDVYEKAPLKLCIAAIKTSAGFSPAFLLLISSKPGKLRGNSVDSDTAWTIDTVFTVDLKEQQQVLRIFRGRCRTRATRQVRVWAEDIPTIILHELAMQHVKVCTRKFRQARGSPVGSPLSPALCGMVVAAHEKIWQRTFRQKPQHSLSSLRRRSPMHLGTGHRRPTRSPAFS